MTAPIRFHPRRFRSAAAHYVLGRPPYAPGLIRRVAECTGFQESVNHEDLGISFATEDIHAHAVLVADEQQIDLRPGHVQVMNPQLSQ